MWDEIFTEKLHKIVQNFQGPLFEIFVKFSDTAFQWHNAQVM